MLVQTIPIFYFTIVQVKSPSGLVCGLHSVSRQKSRCGSGWTPIWRLRERIQFSAHSDYWQNPVLFSCSRAEVLSDYQAGTTLCCWRPPTFSLPSPSPSSILPLHTESFCFESLWIPFLPTARERLSTFKGFFNYTEFTCITLF